MTYSLGAESREMTRYKEKREKQEQQEEDLFTRAPVSKADKKREKHLLSSRNGYVSYMCLMVNYVGYFIIRINLRPLKYVSNR